MSTGSNHPNPRIAESVLERRGSLQDARSPGRRDATEATHLVESAPSPSDVPDEYDDALYTFERGTLPLVGSIKVKYRFIGNLPARTIEIDDFEAGA